MDLEIKDRVARLHLDDGKANAVGHDFIDGLENALERAQREAGALVLVGRPGVFSAGFDLAVMGSGADAAKQLVERGGKMLLRLFGHPQPVVAACTGHALAAGALLLLACDRRIAAEGDFKIGLNETAIGMELPVFGLELARARLDVRQLTTAVVHAHIYDSRGAAAVGYVDEVVAPEDVIELATRRAAALAEIPATAYAANKRAIRRPTIEAIEASLS